MTQQSPAGPPLGEEVAAPTDLIILGRINGVFGVRGWVKVYSETEPRENILRYRPWYLLRSGVCRRAKVIEGRLQGKGLVARLDGCDERDLAHRLIGVTIGVSRSQFEPLEEGEYYWSDLEGLRVQTVDGTDLGVVDHLLETGANDVIVVRGERERLIPYLPGQVIRRVVLGQGLIQVDWDPDF